MSGSCQANIKLKDKLKDCRKLYKVMEEVADRLKSLNVDI